MPRCKEPCIPDANLDQQTVSATLHRCESDQHCRPAALPRLPVSRASSGDEEALTFAHIAPGTTVNNAIDIDALKSRGVALATAPTIMGADIETGGATS
jgi:hypothetical protein